MIGPKKAARLNEYIKALTKFDCRACESRKESILCIPRPIYQRKQNLTPIVIISSYPKLPDERAGLVCQTADKDRITRWLRQANAHDTYITNAFKCPVKLNEYQIEIPPSRKDIHACAHLYLNKEISFIKPKVIVTFGEKAIAGLMKVTMTVAHKYMMCKFTYQGMTVFSMFHPVSMDRGGLEREDECIKMLTEAYKLNKELQNV